MYDAAGEITTGTAGNVYLYDAEGRICAVATAGMDGMGPSMTGYVYDAAGNRVAKGPITKMTCDPTQNGFETSGEESDYIHNPSCQPVTKLTMDEGVMTWNYTNVYADGQLFATYDAQGLHFDLDDWLGTRRVTTDSAGVVEQTCASLPYGDQLNCTGSVDAPNEQHFTGKTHGTESGLDYFGARYYNESDARFMSPDWSAKVEPVPYAKLGNPQSLNLYEYMHDSPLNGVDPDGHYVCADGAKCSSANDKAFQARLNDLKLAQSRLKSGSVAYNRIGKELAYYGGAGATKTANGKTVSIGFNRAPNSGGLTKRVGGEISVNFASNFSQATKSNRLGMTVLVGHEGQHVVDGAPVGTARFRSEFNAERTSQMILDGLAGTKINPFGSFEIRGVTTWQSNGGPLGLGDNTGAAFIIAVKDYRYDLQHY